MDKEKNKAYVCSEWLQDTLEGKAINISISVIINIINFVIKVILIVLIASIREDTKSAMMRSIKVGVFVTQFFNTGVLILLASANLSETKVPVLNELARGPYTDFTSEWYRDVGGIIVKAMVISAIMPLVEIVMFWCLRNGLRWLDRSFTKDVFKSKKKSIQLYIDTYSGPEYTIHFRYSTIMNTTFVCLMYGTALPILFPIALFSFFMLYTVERLQVCYWYKQPPAFDEKMTMNTLRMLLWAPIIYMMFSYWVLSNNQMFDNVVFKYANANDLVLSGHLLIRELATLRLDQSIPCLVMFLLTAFLVPFSSIFTAIVEFFKPDAFKLNLNIDENLGNYFEALEQDDKNQMIVEEENLRKVYVTFPTF